MLAILELAILSALLIHNHTNAVSSKTDITKQVKMEKTVLLYNENRRGLLMSLIVATMVCAVSVTNSTL